MTAEKPGFQEKSMMCRRLLFYSEDFFEQWARGNLKLPWGLWTVHQIDSLSRRILDHSSPVDPELVKELIFFGQESEEDFKLTVRKKIIEQYQRSIFDRQQEADNQTLQNLICGIDFLDMVFQNKERRRIGESRARHAERTLMLFLLQSQILLIIKIIILNGLLFRKS